jgi:hypothetical protein
MFLGCITVEGGYEAGDENVSTKDTTGDTLLKQKAWVKKQDVWIHLYLAAKPEILFHAYGTDDVHINRLGGETISKLITEFAPAFRLAKPHKWSQSKLTSLAKY